MENMSSPLKITELLTVKLTGTCGFVVPAPSDTILGRIPGTACALLGKQPVIVFSSPQVLDDPTGLSVQLLKEAFEADFGSC